MLIQDKWAESLRFMENFTGLVLWVDPTFKEEVW